MINGLALCDALEGFGVPTRVMSAIERPSGATTGRAFQSPSNESRRVPLPSASTS